MKFSEFVGNQEIVNRLKEQASKKNPFHAYIFDGAEGVGKKRLAYTFAQALMCENTEEGEPCQVCSACRKVISGNHGDLHYITVSGNSIKDEQIEEIQEVLYSKPFDGDRTILIIDKADTMTVRAQNRLLKTLEEPGPSVVLILITEKISEMLPTIISRSLVIRLKPVEKTEIRDFLIQNIAADKASADIAAAYAYGSPGKGIRLLEDEDFQARRKRSIECARGLTEKETLTEFMKLLEDDIANKESALDFMEMMSFWYRDLMFIAQEVDRDYILNQDYLEELNVFCKKTGIKKICRTIEKLEETKYDIIMNVNINYALKNLYLEIN